MRCKISFLLFSLALCQIFFSCAASSEDDPDIFLNNTDGIIYNPDMGFYSSIDVKVGENGISGFAHLKNAIKESPTLFDGSYSPDATFPLLHLKFDISDFSGRINSSGDKDLTDKALSDIDALLSRVEDSEKTAIIRFAYDPGYDGKTDSDGKYADVEPFDFEMILSHIEALCPVLKNHERAITAIECGMIGPWGEMHSTTFARGKDGDEFYYIVSVINKFLECLDGCGIPLLVRQPSFIYATVGRDYKSSYKPSSSDDFYRLGIYNDGYLGSPTDFGTFREERKAEIDFLKSFTDHTPYGGELCDGENALWKSDLSSAVEEMSDVHLSFLNIGWNDGALRNLFEKKKYRYEGEQAFIYIIKHMGYRYCVEKSRVVPEDGNVNVSMEIKNSGFADMPMHRKKNVLVFFVREDGTVVNEGGTVVSGAIFEGTTRSLSFSVESPSESGVYDLCFRMCDSDGKYPVRFSSPSWNAEIGANVLGKISVE